MTKPVSIIRKTLPANAPEQEYVTADGCKHIGRHPSFSKHVRHAPAAPVTVATLSVTAAAAGLAGAAVRERERLLAG